MEPIDKIKQYLDKEVTITSELECQITIEIISDLDSCAFGEINTFWVLQPGLVIKAKEIRDRSNPAREGWVKFEVNTIKPKTNPSFRSKTYFTVHHEHFLKAVR
jgi:hypothetical protein